MMQRDTFWNARPLFAPTALRTWLLDAGSLTARIKARCRDFSVQVLLQGGVKVPREESEVLGLRYGEHALGRDVLLRCGAVPVVFAHSVLRCQDLRGPWRSIAGMGSRPLGAALFADPRIERYPLAFHRLRYGHPLYCAAARALGRRPAPLWARRSLFVLHGAPLLVTEAFLPEIIGLMNTGASEA